MTSQVPQPQWSVGPPEKSKSNTRWGVLLLIVGVVSVGGFIVVTRGHAIPGLTADEFRQPFEALGADCSEHAGQIEQSWGWKCNGTGDLEAELSGGGTSEIEIIAASGDSSSPATLTWLKALASVKYEGADPRAAQAWVESHFDDPTCESSQCMIEIGQARLRLRVLAPPVGETMLIVERKDRPVAFSAQWAAMPP